MIEITEGGIVASLKNVADGDEMTRGSVMDYLKAIRERYLRAGAVRNGEGESNDPGRRSQRRKTAIRLLHRCVALFIMYGNDCPFVC